MCCVDEARRPRPRASRVIVAEMSVGLEQLVALLVDHLALVVGDVVVLEQLLADVEVARLDLALRVLDRARDPRMLDRLALGHLQALHDRRDAVAGEDAQQRVFERQVEAARARVALAARAAAQLVVDAPRLVALGADDVQAAGRDHLVVQLLPVDAHLFDAPRLLRLRSSVSSACTLLISGSGLPPSTMSVPRPAMLVAMVIIFGRPACATISASRACCFAFSTLCGSFSFLSMPGEQLGVLDRGRADQHRLAALVAVADVVDDRLVLLARGAEDLVHAVLADHRSGASG